MIDDQLIHTYKPSEFSEIPLRRLQCFLPDINLTSPTDRKILQTWQEHFQSVGRPYHVRRKYGARVALIKEKPE